MQNKTTRTRMKRAIKRAVSPSSGEGAVTLAEAMKRIDKAAKSHAIHANAAARLKSRMARAAARAAKTA